MFLTKFNINLNLKYFKHLYVHKIQQKLRTQKTIDHYENHTTSNKVQI